MSDKVYELLEIKSPRPSKYDFRNREMTERFNNTVLVFRNVDTGETVNYNMSECKLDPLSNVFFERGGEVLEESRYNPGVVELQSLVNQYGVGLRFKGLFFDKKSKNWSIRKERESVKIYN